MMRIFLKSLLAIGILFSRPVWGLEQKPDQGKVLYGGGIARNVVIARGEYEFILMPSPSGKVTGWFLKVKKGKEVQEQEIRQGRKNTFRFGEEVIEVENKSVVPLWKESKFMMAETVGEFRIVLKKIRESKGLYFREEDFGGMKSLVVGNQTMEMELIPEKRGAIVAFTDKSTGTDFVYLPPGGDIKKCRGSAGQGIIELIGGLDAVINDEMMYRVKREGDRFTLFLEGSYRDDIKVGRRMEFGKTFAGVDISSWIKVNKGEGHWLRHRGEMRLGGDIGEGDVFYFQEEGKIRKLVYLGGQAYFRDTTWLVGVDEQKKIGLVSVYEPENFETLYIYMGGEYFTWEAWTKKVILGRGEDLRLNARYFIIRGIEGIDSVSREGIMHIKLTRDCYDIGELVNMEVGVGLCQAENVNIVWSIEDSSGRLCFPGKRKLFCSPGEMKYVKVNWKTEKDGKYLFKAAIREGGRNILAATKPLLVSSERMKELNQREEELMTRIRALRKEWQRKGASEIKDKLFRLEEIRMQIEEYKKSGQIEKTLDILREVLST